MDVTGDVLLPECAAEFIANKAKDVKICIENVRNVAEVVVISNIDMYFTTGSDVKRICNVFF